MKKTYHRKRLKLKTRSALRKDADAIFSKYIRHKHADDNGYIRCYTCGKVRLVKEMQCGHFISRTKYATRFDEDNCRPQCVACNMFHEGNGYIFGKKLEAEGIDVEALFIKSNKVVSLDYEEIIEKCKSELKKMEVKL